MAEDLIPNDITFFAETNYRGQHKRFGIKRNDRRKHVYIIGKTGMGKSTLLENMTIQDIQAGRGVAVVDPHGEYAEKMLDFVPQHRISDVVYFNPSDLEFPIAFNIMENVAEDQRHLISSGLLSVFKKIFGPDTWSARMEYLLANAVLALLEIPGATLLSINRMFGEKDFRKRIVSQLTDPVIRGFWENEFAKYPEQYMREAVAAIQNKIGQFSGNPLIRNVIGQAHTSFDLRKIMDEEKILIINLSKGRIGEENSRLLGAMMVTKLYITAMSRVDIPEPERKDFYLYVDEFQNFATESFANILSEARKYRLNLTVAHQYVAQMEEEVQHAIFGNVGTMIAFRVGAEDAELLEKEYMPEFVIQDLVNQGFKQIYLKLMIDGITSRPFSAETLAPMPHLSQSFREDILKSSRERFGTPRSVVEGKIRRFTEAASGETHPAIAAGAAADEVGAPGPASMPPKPERKMYEARCAVDGKTIMVPFEPDGRRPVYCEEHMDMIKLRSKAVPAPAAGNAPSLRDVRPVKTPQPISLGALKRPAVVPPRRDPVPAAVKPKSETHLSGLRQALEESLRGEKNAPARKESADGPRQEPFQPSSLRELKPGERISFE